MRLPLLLLLLVSIMAQVGTGFPSDRSRSKQASWDEVNVVAHGLLQLGQGLKEHVDKIKTQMRDVNTKLKVINVTVTELVKSQQEQDEALKTRGDEAVEEAVRAKVEEEVKKENKLIHSRMDRLEAMLGKAISEPKVESNFSDGPAVPFIQKMVEAQNRRIDELMEKIKQQQDKLEKQSLQNKKRVKSHRRRDEETTLKGEAEHEATTGVGRDCHDLFVQGQRVSGVYTIQPENSRPFNVLCEMTPEGGWTVIQKRHDGSQNFNQLWEHYQKGFGSLSGEFWLGLENIHSLSKQGQYLLQVEISDWFDQQRSAQYQFQLDEEEAMYALHLEQVPSSGDLEEAVTTAAAGLPFSTSDKDNDLNADVNCADLLTGGWWFSSCGDSNLNGKYPRRPTVTRRHNRMFWATNGLKASLKKTVMKIAPSTMS